MKTIAIWVVLGLLAGPAYVRAEAAAPATRPVRLAIPRDQTPRDALLRATQVFDLFDVDAALELYDYTGEAEAKLCRLQCEYDIAIARLEKLVNAKWGQTADDALVHALGEQTDGDVKEAKITVEGDHAVVEFKDEEATEVPMVRVNGAWKFAWHEIAGSMTADELKEFAADQAAVRDGIPRIMEDLKAGRLRSSQEVVAAAKELNEEATKAGDHAKK